MSVFNKRVCGASGVLGTNNKKGCPFDFKDIQGFFVIHPSSTVTSGSNLISQLKALQLAGKAEVFQGVDGVEATGNDDTVNASTKGVNKVSIKGLYQFKLTFIEDLYFHSALTSFDSFKGWNTGLFDSEGNVLMTEKSDGTGKGFSTGMIRTDKYVFGSAEQTMTSVEFQWLSRKEFDSDFIFVDASQLDESVLDWEGIVQSTLEYYSAPANTDTEVLVSAVLSRGGHEYIETFTDTADWAVKVDGVGVTVSAVSYNSTDNYYTLTIPSLATNNVVSTSLADVVDITGDAYYKSAAIKATV